MKTLRFFCTVSLFLSISLCNTVLAYDFELLTNIGLYGGRLPTGTSTFANDSSGAIYMCVEGAYALYKSTDGGESWSHSNDNAGGTGVVVLSDDSVIVVTSSGVEKSTDGGSTWSTLDITGSSSSVARTITLHGSDIYVGGDGGIYKSSDSGASWSYIGDPESGWQVEGIAVTSDSIYAIANTKLYKGTPLSSPSFTDKTPDDPSGMLAQNVTVDPNDQSIVYVAGSVEGSGPSKVSKSIDGGESWTDISISDPDSPQVGGPVIIAPDSSIIWSSTCYSTDGGTTWIPLGIPGGSSNPNHVLFLDPSDSNILYASSDICASKSVDNGSSWTDISDGIENLQVNDVAQSPVDPNVFIVASKSGLGRSSDAGSSWSWISHGSPKHSIDFSGSIAYYGDGNGINYSSDGGESFTEGGCGFEAAGYSGSIMDIYIESASSVHAAVNDQDSTGGGAYKYSGGTAGTWTPLGSSSNVQDKRVNCIAMNGGTLYAGVGDQDGNSPGGIYTSPDGGTTWIQVSDLATACVWDFAFDGSTVYAAAGNLTAPGGGTTSNASVWIGNGSSWTESPVVEDARQPVKAVLVDPSSTNTIYAASSNVIYRNDNSGNPGDWYAFLEEKDGVEFNVLQITDDGASSRESSTVKQVTPSTLRMGSTTGYYGYGAAKTIVNLCLNKTSCYRDPDTVKIYYNIQPGSDSSYNVPCDVYLAVRLETGAYLFYTPEAGLSSKPAPYASGFTPRQMSGKLAQLPASAMHSGTYTLCALLWPTGRPMTGTVEQITQNGASLFEEQPVTIERGGSPRE